MSHRVRLGFAIWCATMGAVVAIVVLSSAERRCRDEAAVSMDDSAKSLRCPHSRHRLAVSFVEGQMVGECRCDR